MSNASQDSGALTRPGLANTAAPTFADKQRVPLSVDPSDAGVRVHVMNGGAGGTSAADETAFVEGSTTFTGAGAVFNDSLGAVSSGFVAWLRMTALRALHINLRNNSGTEIGTLANPLRNQQVGTNPVQIQDGSGNSLGSNGTALLVTQTPGTAGGLSISRTLSAANTTGISVKGSAGQLYGWAITNTNASARFVKLYNKASAPTVGADTPVITLCIPGNATGAGMVAAEFVSGLALGTGIGLGITTGVADADTGAPSANEVIVNLFYK